jgi:hypothetical protein
MPRAWSAWRSARLGAGAAAGAAAVATRPGVAAGGVGAQASHGEAAHSASTRTGVERIMGCDYYKTALITTAVVTISPIALVSHWYRSRIACHGPRPGSRVQAGRWCALAAIAAPRGSSADRCVDRTVDQVIDPVIDRV